MNIYWKGEDSVVSLITIVDFTNRFSSDILIKDQK
jgi:hypothetical protein